jgi:hypothetical protein
VNDSFERAAGRLAQETLSPSRAFRVPENQNKYFISMYIDDVLVHAFPDNCSGLNLISAALVPHIKLDDHTETFIRLPDERLIKTSGTGTIHCKFTEDGETSKVNFTVLPGSLHGVILSDYFL